MDISGVAICMGPAWLPLMASISNHSSILSDVKPSNGKVVGKGAYGEVVELNYCGKNVAGKRMYPIFFTANQEETQSELERFRKECAR